MNITSLCVCGLTKVSSHWCLCSEQSFRLSLFSCVFVCAFDSYGEVFTLATQKLSENAIERERNKQKDKQKTHKNQKSNRINSTKVCSFICMFMALTFEWHQFSNNQTSKSYLILSLFPANNGQFRKWTFWIILNIHIYIYTWLYGIYILLLYISFQLESHMYSDNCVWWILWWFSYNNKGKYSHFVAVHARVSRYDFLPFSIHFKLKIHQKCLLIWLQPVFVSRF